MSCRQWFYAVCCLLGQLVSVQAQIFFSTTPKQVTLYLNYAELQHEVELTLPAGTHQLIFEQLPLSMQDESIQLQIEGSGTLLTVNKQINYLQTLAERRETEALREKATLLKQQAERLKLEKDTYLEEQNLLLANRQVGGEKGATAEQLQKMADFYRQRLLYIKKHLFDIEQEYNRLQEEYEKIRQQLQRQEEKRPSAQVNAIVKTSSSGRLMLRLRYVITDAGWYPLYDLRVAEVNAPVHVHQKAMVYQRTGLDWEGVQLRLSTGNPAITGTKPELPPRYVDFYRPPILMQRREAVSLQPESAFGLPELKQAPQADNTALTFDPNHIAESSLQLTFDIASPVNIAGNGQEQLIDIQQQQAKARYQYAAVPRLSQEAFLMAQIEDWAKLHLLPGKANVYFSGNYVGSTWLNTNITEDTLSLSLGRDMRIICLHREIQQYTTKRTLKNHIEEEYAYEIAIRNNRKESINIMVEDQIPISMQNRIQVEALELSGGVLDTQNGIVRWQLNILPAQEVKKVLRFRIVYPKGQRIVW